MPGLGRRILSTLGRRRPILSTPGLLFLDRGLLPPLSTARYNELSPVEKILFAVASVVLAHRRARIGLFVYIVRPTHRTALVPLHASPCCPWCFDSLLTPCAFATPPLCTAPPAPDGVWHDCSPRPRPLRGSKAHREAHSRVRHATVPLHLFANSALPATGGEALGGQLFSAVLFALMRACCRCELSSFLHPVTRFH
eukprot:scaffold246_cov97-Isochrysis_galbana.AAC.4